MWQVATPPATRRLFKRSLPSETPPQAGSHQPPIEIAESDALARARPVCANRQDEYNIGGSKEDACDATEVTVLRWVREPSRYRMSVVERY